MPTGTAYIAKGTAIGYKYGAASAYVPINPNFLIAVSPPPYGYSEADTTPLSSGAVTSIPGILDSGEFSFTMQYVSDDPSIQFMQGQIAAPAIGLWKITYADIGTEVFNGWLKGFAPQSDDAPDAIQELEVTIRVTGFPTFTPNPV